jgi:hypothetical protein
MKKQEIRDAVLKRLKMKYSNWDSLNKEYQDKLFLEELLKLPDAIMAGYKKQKDNERRLTNYIDNVFGLQTF